MRYRRLSFALPRTAEEPLSGRLWALGCLGLELADDAEGRLRVDAWFDEPPPAALDGIDWPAHEAELVASEAIEEEDWMAAYRRHAQPLRVGRRLVVDPRDEAQRPAAVGADELWLHLPARRAFGTGSHESTRLAVELLERLPLAGRNVLDLGTGTGVLAFVALAAGARQVVALDLDPLAALIAGQNRARNRIWPEIVAGAIDCIAAAARFDVAVVNILPELVRDDLPALAGLLRPGADALFSGLIESERPGYEARLAALGLTIHGRRRIGDWAALHARRAP